MFGICSIISMSLDIWTRSAMAYTNLQMILKLPSTRQLQRYKNYINQVPGILPENLHWMLLEADRRKLSTNGRCGCIVFDEIQIQVIAHAICIVIMTDFLNDFLLKSTVLHF